MKVSLQLDYENCPIIYLYLEYLSVLPDDPAKTPTLPIPLARNPADA